MLQILPHAGVGKAHVPELDVGGVFLRAFPGEHRQVLRKLQHIRHPACAGLALGPHDEDSGDPQHGVEDHGEVLQKGHNHTAPDGPGVDPESPDDHHQGQPQVENQGGNRVRDAGDDAGLGIHPAELIVYPAEAVLFVFGFAQGLDDPDAGDVLLHGAHHIVQNPLLSGVEPNAGFGDEVHHHRDEGQQRQQHQGQHRIHAQHHADAPQQQNGGPDAQPLDPGQQLVYIVGVAGEPGLGGGYREGIHLPLGEALQLMEQVVAQRQGDFAGAFGAHAVCQDVEAQASPGGQQHGGPQQEDGPYIPGGDLHVQHVLHHIGNQQLHHRAQQLDEHREQNVAPIGADIPRQPRHEVHLPIQKPITPEHQIGV